MDYTLEDLSTDSLAKFLGSQLLLFVVVGLCIAKVLLSLATVNVPQNTFFAAITAGSLESMLNAARQESDLPQLKDNSQLDTAAQLKAQDMIQNQYFAHTSPTGVTPWYWFGQVDYPYQYAGENLAIGFYDSSDVFQAWMNSPEHKANILNSHYQDVGTAVVSGYGANGTTVVVQLFGSPAVAAAKTNQPVASVLKTIASAPETVSVVKSPTENNPSTINLLPALEKNTASDYTAYLQAILLGLLALVAGSVLTIIAFALKSLVTQTVQSAAVRSLAVMGVIITALWLNSQTVAFLISHPFSL